MDCPRRRPSHRDLSNLFWALSECRKRWAWVGLVLLLLSPSVRATGETSSGFARLDAKLKSGEPLRVAYLGGSITVGAATHPLKGTDPDGRPYDFNDYRATQDSWRALTFAWLNDQSAGNADDLKQVHAALGSTQSELAVFRYAQDIGRPGPDLLFLEFSVNNVGHASRQKNNQPATIAQTFAALVEHARRDNPETAVVVVITAIRPLTGGESNPQEEARWRGLYADSVLQTRDAADRLGVALVDCSGLDEHGKRIDPVEQADWFAGALTPGNRVHPAPAGHAAYAQRVNDSLASWLASPPEISKADEAPTAFPRGGAVIDAEALLAQSRGFRLIEVLPRERIEPALAKRSVLVAESDDAELNATFSGGTIGVWLQQGWRGGFDAFIDDHPAGRFVAPPDRKPGLTIIPRHHVLSYDLAPDQTHTLRLVPIKTSPDQEINLGLIGLLVTPQEAEPQ